MKPVLKHSWKLSPEKAEKLQRELAGRIDNQAPFKTAEQVRSVAALDVYYGNEKGPVVAAVAVFELPSLDVVETVSVTEKAAALFPYIPGLLSFREIPPILKALKKLKTNPDVLLVDGQGMAHPRHFGLACHLGLVMNKPSVGCAEGWLYGDYEEPPPGLAGSYTMLRDGDAPIGTVLRTKPFTQPLFVSPGHKMGVLLAVDIVMACVKGNRLPEPLRLADQISRKSDKKKKTRRPQRHDS